MLCVRLRREASKEKRSLQLEIPLQETNLLIKIFYNHHQFKTEQEPSFVYNPIFYYQSLLKNLNRWMKNSRNGWNKIFARKRSNERTIE